MNPETWVAILIVAGGVVALVWWLRRSTASRGAALGLSNQIRRRYTRHARDRMRERRINQDQVEQVLTRPDRREFDPAEDSYRFERDFHEVVIKVWVAAKPWPPTDEVVIKSTAGKHFVCRQLPADVVPRVIGRGGVTINQIRDSTRATISVGDNGDVRISAGDRVCVDRAWRQIEQVANRPLPALGERSRGTVVKLSDGGAVVSLANGHEGFLPVAMLRPLVDGKRIAKVRDVVNVGQALQVEVSDIRDGKIRLVAIPD
jgi:hypothetical protein